MPKLDRRIEDAVANHIQRHSKNGGVSYRKRDGTYTVTGNHGEKNFEVALKEAARKIQVATGQSKSPSITRHSQPVKDIQGRNIPGVKSVTCHVEGQSKPIKKTVWNWSEKKVADEISSAMKNAKQLKGGNPNHWVGRSKSGVIFEGYNDPKSGKLNSAWPIDGKRLRIDLPKQIRNIK